MNGTAHIVEVRRDRASNLLCSLMEYVSAVLRTDNVVVHVIPP